MDHLQLLIYSIIEICILLCYGAFFFVFFSSSCAHYDDWYFNSLIPQYPPHCQSYYLSSICVYVCVYSYVAF